MRKYFGKRGEQIVQDNLTCVKRGYSEMQEITAEIAEPGYEWSVEELEVPGAPIPVMQVLGMPTVADPAGHSSVF